MRSQISPIYYCLLEIPLQLIDMRLPNSGPCNDSTFLSSSHSVPLLVDIALRKKKENSFNSLQPFEFVGIIEQKTKQHACHLIPS